MKKLQLLSIMMIATINSAVAANLPCTQNVCDVNHIVSLNISRDDDAVFIQPKGTLNLLCQMDARGVKLSKNHVMFDEIYSLVLSAKLTVKPIQIKIADTPPVLSAVCEVENIEYTGK